MWQVDDIVANSFKNFHAKGVDYLCLGRTPELTRKLYLFDGDVAKFPEVVHPHDHRYPFRTKVLTGALRNSIYEPHDHGVVFNQFAWRTPLNGGGGFEWQREARLRLAHMSTFFPGETHSMLHDGIHTIKVLENQTVLLQDQYGDVLPLDAATSTFSLDREPPGLDGLYERFTADEVMDRLRRVERFLPCGC